MSARLPWILLAISVVLNLAIVGGLLYGWQGGERSEWGPEKAVERLAEELDLTAPQQDSFKAVIAQAVAWRQARRQSPSPQRQALVEHLGAPSFDAVEVERLLGEMSAERNLQWLEVTRGLHGFVATLDAEQKEAFLSMARDPGFFRKLFRPARRDRK